MEVEATVVDSATGAIARVPQRHRRAVLAAGPGPGQTMSGRRCSLVSSPF